MFIELTPRPIQCISCNVCSTLRDSVSPVRGIFTASAPLGRFSHRVAMSVCGSVCGSAPSGIVFFRTLLQIFHNKKIIFFSKSIFFILYINKKKIPLVLPLQEIGL